MFKSPFGQAPNDDIQGFQLEMARVLLEALWKTLGPQGILKATDAVKQLITPPLPSPPQIPQSVPGASPVGGPPSPAPLNLPPSPGAQPGGPAPQIDPQLLAYLQQQMGQNSGGSAPPMTPGP